MSTSTALDARMPRGPRNRGSTVIIVMIFLSLFATLAMAFNAATTNNLRHADSSRKTVSARLAAESGLQYVLMLLHDLRIPPDEARNGLLAAVHARLASRLDGSTVLGGGTVSFDGATITLPQIQAGGRQAFNAQIGQAASGNLWVRVTGDFLGVGRGLVVEVEPESVISVIFDYGVASKGKILVGGDGTLIGWNRGSEANILSATYTDLEAVAISGNSVLSGDIFTSNPNSYVSITGTPTIAGTSDRSEFPDHIHVGVGDPGFPEIDTSIYTRFVTNTFPSSGKIDSDTILENVRIPAGANPTFNSNVVIRGVLHIEQPNQVKFNGNCLIQGVIVTDDAGPTGYTSNTLIFNGSAEAQGVESLPDEPQFHELRQMPGTMILAPGFGVDFSGNFTTLNGAIAAHQIEMTGNSGGVVRGPIICYGDTEFKLWGSSHVMIDKSYYTGTPPGFINPVRLVPDPDSYREVLTQ